MKSEKSSKDSGAFHFKDKGHLKAEKASGAHHNKAKGHELPAKAEGRHVNNAKPIVHTEQVGVTHNGRPLPQETILKDSKIIQSGSGHSGRLAKRNE